MTETPPLFCWTYPRTLSTAFEKCIHQASQHTDLVTLHEPFSLSHYSKKPTAGLSKINVDFMQVVENIQALSKRHRYVFIKELAYCVVNAPEFEDSRVQEFFSSCRHAFLIRDPELSIPSLVAQMRKVYGNDCPRDQLSAAYGIKELSRMHDWLTSKGLSPVAVLDASDLEEQPHETVESFCKAVDIPFHDSMLQWQEGTLSDWKHWSSQGWHSRAEKSTGFKKSDSCYDQEKKEFDKDIQELKQYYNELKKLVSC